MVMGSSVNLLYSKSNTSTKWKNQFWNTESMYFLVNHNVHVRYVISVMIIGWAWVRQSPTLIMRTAPVRRITVCTCIYVSMYHLPRICHTLVPEICVHPEILGVFRYIGVLTCMIYNCMHSTEQQRRSELLVSAVKILMKTGRWMHRHTV